MKSAKACCIAAGLIGGGAAIIMAFVVSPLPVIAVPLVPVIAHSLFALGVCSFFGFMLGGAAGALYGIAYQEKKKPEPVPTCACDPKEASMAQAPSQQQSQTTFRDKVDASRQAAGAERYV